MFPPRAHPPCLVLAALAAVLALAPVFIDQARAEEPARPLAGKSPESSPPPTAGSPAPNDGLAGLAGLVLRLSASDPRSLEPAPGTDAPDAPVAVWRDLSPARNDVVPPTERRAPRRLGNLKGPVAVRFSGEEILQTPRLAGFQSGEQPFHLFLVLRSAGGDDTAARVADLSPVGSDPDATKAYTRKRTGFWIGTQAEDAAAGQLRIGVHVGDEGHGNRPSFDGQFHVVEVVYPGRQRWAIHQDGHPIGRGKFGSDRTFLGFDGGAKLALGGLFGSTNRTDFFRGDLAEVLLFQRPLRVDEQRQVGRALALRHGLSTAYPDRAPPVPSFEEGIRPILDRHCERCHGEREPEAGLRIGSFQDLLRGGQGGPSVAPGDASRSLLFHVLEAGEMPPPGKRQAGLSNDDVETIRRWLDGGAPSRDATSTPSPAAVPVPGPAKRSDHWAFRKLARPAVPEVPEEAGTRSDIDRFVAARLASAGLRMSAPAPRLTLMRRACLDLTGVLPSPSEVDAYLAEDRPDAYERLLDRLLASPQFGERWARHWLDGAGYSDTGPLDNDAGITKPGPGKWEYRDYVARALNEDRPYDRFLREQLAGDELIDWRGTEPWTPETRELLVATGFLRCAADVTDENELNTLQVRFDVLHRTADTLAGHLLGLTLACARCHDHKYEPISQQDYYRFTSVLAPALNPHHWLQPAARQLVALPPPEKAVQDRDLAAARATARMLRESAEARLSETKLAQVPTPIRDDVREALGKPSDQRTEVQRYLADKFGSVFRHAPDEIPGALSPAQRPEYEGALTRIRQITNRWDAVGTIQAVYDVAPPSATFVLRRGNYETPGAEIGPGLFAVLADPARPWRADPPPKGATSGRRLALAQALSDWNSPAGALAARVRVNQVWQNLFGVGLVETPDNFGVAGPPPSHPDLLEWLAAEFVRGGARLKPLLKLVMTSSVYRQSASADPAAAAAAGIDPANRLLWRQRLRRLEAEVVRDSLLRAAGRLDLSVGGPPVRIRNRPDGKVVEDTGPTNQPLPTARRSLYLLNRRNYNLSLLAAFDQPLMALNCPRRTAAAVVQQSLAMLNDEFVHAQSAALAARIRADMPTAEPADSLRAIFRRILVRPPAPEELALLEAAFARHQRAFLDAGHDPESAARRAFAELGRVLFNTSEFLYAD